MCLRLQAVTFECLDVETSSSVCRRSFSLQIRHLCRLYVWISMSWVQDHCQILKIQAKSKVRLKRMTERRNQCLVEETEYTHAGGLPSTEDHFCSSDTSYTFESWGIQCKCAISACLCRHASTFSLSLHFSVKEYVPLFLFTVSKGSPVLVVWLSNYYNRVGYNTSFNCTFVFCIVFISYIQLFSYTAARVIVKSCIRQL